MTLIDKLRNLKNFDLVNLDISLAVVKEYKQNRVSHYSIKYVQIDEGLETRLRNILSRKIENLNACESYSFDCPEPEGDEVRAIDCDKTDFNKILQQLSELNPEEDLIDGIDELVRAKAYLIILRDNQGIQAIGFKTLPESWKMKRNKGLIPLLFKENRFEGLEDENVFSISNTLDIIYFNETLFILSKKNFEVGLNFREGIIAKADELFQEVEGANLFANVNLLKVQVGDNQRYLRKIATIKNLGHYNNPVYIQKLQQISSLRNWNILFNDGQIVFSEDNIDDILTLLQNKRLLSEMTEEIFDVDSAKKLE